MESAHGCQSENAEPVARPQKPIQSLQLVSAFCAEENCESEDFVQIEVTHIPRKVLSGQEGAIHRQDPNKKRHRMHMQLFDPPDYEEEQGVDHSTKQNEYAPQLVHIQFVSKLDIFNACFYNCADHIDQLLATLMGRGLSKLSHELGHARFTS